MVKWLVGSVVSILVVSCTPDNPVSGGETQNEDYVAVYMPDGVTPAANAAVKIIPSDRNQRTVTAKKRNAGGFTVLTTDENGHFTVPSLSDSTYNIFLEKDSLKAFQKSRLITSSGHLVSDDTLQQTGSFTATVALQPSDMDKIRSVVVQILGSDIEYRSLDRAGMFRFDGLARGQYRLKIETSVPNYGDVFFDMAIMSGVDSIYPDTIDLPFNGIHAVRNLSADYDTGNGLVLLTWSPTEYTDLLDYVIYRDPASAKTYSKTIHATSLDTMLVDTIFDIGRTKGDFSLADTTRYSFKYRAAVRNNSTEIGTAHGVLGVTAYPPSLVKTTFRFSFPRTDTSSLSINDTIHIAALMRNENRTLRSTAWAVDSLENRVRSIDLDSTKKRARDTLSVAFPEIGFHKVYAISEDIAGSEWVDSTEILVLPLPPQAALGRDTTVSIKDTVHLRAVASDNGEVVAYRWKFDNKKWTGKASADTFVVVPSKPRDAYVCSLEVTDDDGIKACASRVIRVRRMEPTVQAGRDTSVSINDTVHLYGRATDNGTIVKYEWKIGSGEWLETSTPETSIVAPSAASDGIACRLRATDDDGQSATGSMTVKVTNSAPVVSAGKDTIVGIGTSVHLHARASDDGGIAKSEWSFLGSRLVETSTGDTVITAPLEEGVYECAVRVTDDDGRESADVVAFETRRFTAVTVFKKALNASDVFAVDMDGDGDIDLLSASRGDDAIRWYENDGAQGFTAHTIFGGADGAESVFAIDMDGDGDTDVLSASSHDNAIRWYENDGVQNFIPRVISVQAKEAQSVFAIDVDGDDDMDVLSASAADDAIRWYENDGAQGFTAHTIFGAADGVRSVFAIDLDADGDIDVLSASYNDDAIRWYENDGARGFTAHTVFGAANGASSVFAIDMDGDNDVDVLSASIHDDDIRWYENDGTREFTAHTIFGTANGASSVFAIDVDGDNDVDVLSASYIDDDIRWFENDGTREFTAHTIFGTANGARSVFAIDMDGDNDVDVLSASSTVHKIRWHENHQENLTGE